MSLANISSTKLEMKKLMGSVSYSVNISKDYAVNAVYHKITHHKDPTITIYYGLTGYDSESYELNTTSQVIEIREQEFRKPKILDYEVKEVNRSTATFQIYGDIKGFIYYTYAD